MIGISKAVIGMADIYTYTREKLETKPGDFLSVFTYYVVAISKFVRFEFINAFFPLLSQIFTSCALRSNLLIVLSLFLDFVVPCLRSQ